jgi:hypothetical protein
MATITLTISHPQLSKTQTLTVPDARLVEFIDNLRNHVYQPPNQTRVQAVDALAANWETNVRRLYKHAKEAADRAALPAPGEIDEAI